MTLSTLKMPVLVRGLADCVVWRGHGAGSCAARVTALAVVLLVAQAARSAEPLAQLEEQAMKAAVAQVAPSVVRIEAVGGLEQVGGMLVGTGSTTGLIVSADGFIISSAFNFAQKPDSILVTLPDGARTAARLVATDSDRKLVLLKVASAKPLAVPVAVPGSDVHVGQWALAVGRTFDADQPSISMGIVSAVERIWGKAIQTDAKVSPSNYGGPLVDITGRVLGVLVPLAPETGSETAGVNWYDSGIGFAVPLEHIFKMLPKLREGHDLKPGVLGINLKGSDMFAVSAEIAACRVNSPAYKAGIKVGDIVVSADGRPVTRQAQLKTVLGSHYAGEHMALVLERGKERINADVELTDKLEPYEYPFLGILPLRVAKPNQFGKIQIQAAEGGKAAAKDKDEDKDTKNDKAKPEAQPAGFTVRYVYPDSPAAAAGVMAGDIVRSLAGKPVADAMAANEILRDLGPGETISLEVARGEKTKKLEITLRRLPEGLPATLPPAHAGIEAPAADPAIKADVVIGRPKAQVGRVTLKLPEFDRACLAYVPEGYNPDLQYGLVVWLHGPGGNNEDELVARWKPLCEAHDLILLAPKSADPNRWQPTENSYIRRMMKEVAQNYRLDPMRIVAHGRQAGGGMAYIVGFANRDAIRAVAAVDATVPALAEAPENNPVQRLAFYTTEPPGLPATSPLLAGIKRLRELKFPVTVQSVSAPGQPLTDEELSALARWIDTLDRL